MKFPRLILLFLLCARGMAIGQDYLYDDMEPSDQASEMATPFTPLKALEPEGKLGTFSDEPFVRDITFSLRPRFFYRSVRNALGVQDTFAAGGSAAVTTGWWLGFLQIGAAGYLTEPLVAVRNNNRSGLVQTDGEGFFTLGEAWLKLKAGNVTATLFRQRLNLPFINMNDSRMIPNTFEAYQFDAKFWEVVRVNAGYVAQIKARNSPDFVPMSEAAGAPDVNRGTAFAGFVAGEEDETYVGVMGEVTWDLFSCVYAQAGRAWEVSPDFEVRGDVQFADQRSTGAAYIGDFATQLYGGRIAASYGGAVLSFAYTKTAAGSGLIDPYGGDPAFNSLMISNFALEDEHSYGAHLSFDFAKIGLDGMTAFGSYVLGALEDGNWEREVNATLDYRIRQGLLKNFWLRLRYAYNESSVSVPIEDFRVILNYSVSF
ncbi:MAG TPA: OprD family outer membrane porin [Terrimicrobiaceae bacterium]|nr:OprD family outer membrane porin [Terrimicrobiaceae bacterium]